MIYNVKIPSLPQFRFEWHHETRKVYYVRLGTVPEVGEILAHDIDNRGAATNAVLIWCRGYREAKSPAIGGLELHEREAAAKH